MTSCRKIGSTKLQFSIRSLLAVTACICILVSICYPLRASPILCIWAGLQVLVLVAFGHILLTAGRPSVAEATAALFSLISWFTLTVFVLVFVIGGSSNVAQLAGSSGMDGWAIWFNCFPVNLVGNLLSIIVTVFCIFGSRKLLASRFLTLAAFICAVIAFYITIEHFPDA